MGESFRGSEFTGAEGSWCVVPLPKQVQPQCVRLPEMFVCIWAELGLPFLLLSYANGVRQMSSCSLHISPYVLLEQGHPRLSGPVFWGRLGWRPWTSPVGDSGQVQSAPGTGSVDSWPPSLSTRWTGCRSDSGTGFPPRAGVFPTWRVLPSGPCRGCVDRALEWPSCRLPRRRPGGHVRLLVLPRCQRLTWAGQGEERFHTFCSGFISFSGK